MIFENVQQQFRQQEHKCAQGETDGIMVYCIVITSSKEITNGNNQCWADTGFEG